jgi:hypothetical protein
VLTTGGTVQPGNPSNFLTLNGDYNQAGTLAVGDSVIIVNNDGTDAISGTITGLPQGSKFSAGGKLLQISYTGGTGNDVTLTVVTPPVSGFTVNNGDLQRSRLTTITVAFTTPQDAAAFQALGAVTLANGTTTVDTTNGLIVSPAAGMTTSLVLTFAHVETAGVEYGSLADGYWRVATPGLGYLSPLNDPSLRRLFGDINGDGQVDGGTDFAAFALGDVTPITMALDFNADGTIDGGTDFAEFGDRFGRTI